VDLTKYYDEICKQKMLSREEEQELFKTYYNKDLPEKERSRARDVVIKANLRYVFKKAKDLSRNDQNQFEDLIAAGNEGLLVGFNKFDHHTGVKFLTYAGWWVLQRQLKAMSQMRVVALPIWKQQLSTRILKAQNSREVPLTLDELCERFPDVARKDLNELSKTRYLTYFFEDVTESEKLINPFEGAIETEIESTFLHNALTTLPEDLSRIVYLTFGMDTGKERRAASVAREMSMPKDMVRAKRSEAIRLLKKYYLKNEAQD